MKPSLKNSKIGDDFTAAQDSHLRSSQTRAHSRCSSREQQSPAPNRLQCRAYPHCPIVAHHETSSHWLVPGFSFPCSVGNPCSQLNVFASVHLHFVVSEQGESNMDWCGEINIEQPRPSRPPTAQRASLVFQVGNSTERLQVRSKANLSDLDGPTVGNTEPDILNRPCHLQLGVHGCRHNLSYLRR